MIVSDFLRLFWAFYSFSMLVPENGSGSRFAGFLPESNIKSME
jgi:hypothetical protein